jgi:4,5-epoxidase
LRTDWLVGCDGAHSVVRGVIGATFDGKPLDETFLHRRMASTFRRGRILIAGDAAHLTNPLGGQGLNICLDDAFNLGWKLAMVILRRADECLLDSYEAERRSTAERIERATTWWTHARRKALRSSYWRGPLTPSVISTLLTRLIDGGPQAGDEAPDARCKRSHDSKRTSLGREVGAHWGLIFFGGPEDAIQACVDVARSRLANHLQVIRVAIGNDARRCHRDDVVEVDDDQGAIVSTYRPGKATAILLRPDGHLAWRSREPDFLELTLWLDGTLREKTGGSNAPERAGEIRAQTQTSDARLSA